MQHVLPQHARGFVTVERNGTSCAGAQSFRQLLRAVEAATADARAAGSAPLPALARALGVDERAPAFPIYQTAVALRGAGHDSSTLMQLATEALGVRPCDPCTAYGLLPSILSCLSCLSCCSRPDP